MGRRHRINPFSRTSGKSVKDLHAFQIFYGGTFPISDAVWAQDLKSFGILFSPTTTQALAQHLSDSGEFGFKAEVNMEEDFLMYTALWEYGKRKLVSDNSGHLLSFLGLQDLPLSMLQDAVKDRATECQVAIALLRAILAENLLEQALKPFLPDKFVWPRMLKGATCRVEGYDKKEVSKIFFHQPSDGG